MITQGNMPGPLQVKGYAPAAPLSRRSLPDPELLHPSGRKKARHPMPGRYRRLGTDNSVHETTPKACLRVQDRRVRKEGSRCQD